VIGAVIDGTYRVVERLGAGAMGEVYLVEHLQLGRREAIKVLLPELAQDQTLAARFRREARAINRLRHPHIVGIYDFGQLPDGRLYLAMEYAAGESLDLVLDHTPGRRLPLARALLLAHQLAGAIDHAHREGVVHRDLKPANLMVIAAQNKPDVLKILDFGVAKVIDAEGGRNDELTRRGEVFGTPEYLAPERLAPGTDDPRSDLYAIGCILHEMVAGAAPFAGSLAFVLASHMSLPPPRLATRVPGGVPPQLEGLVWALLAKTPAERPQSGAEVQRALEQIPGFSARPGGPAPVDDERTVIAMQGPATPTARDLREQLCEIMMQIAEGALAQSPHDQTLAAALGYVRGVRDEKVRLIAARGELDEHQVHTVQSSREKEGSLRFAIADLRFERQRAGSPAEAMDVDFQIDALSMRVAEVSSSMQRALRDLDAHGVHLASYEYDLEPRWVAAHRHLRQVLGNRIGGIAGTIDALL